MHRRSDPSEFVLGKETIHELSGKASGITAPVPSLQSAVHSVGYLFIVPVRQSHCGVEKDACKVMKPECGTLGPHALYPGQDFCACLELTIPNFARAGVSPELGELLYKIGSQGELPMDSQQEPQLQ